MRNTIPLILLSIAFVVLFIVFVNTMRGHHHTTELPYKDIGCDIFSPECSNMGLTESECKREKCCNVCYNPDGSYDDCRNDCECAQC